MLGEEIGGSMEIDGLSWMKSDGDPSSELWDFQIYMGLCAADELTDVFADNFIPGTRTLVLDTSSQSFQGNVGDWMDVDFQTTYWFSGQENLLVEVLFDGGDGTLLYNFNWDTGTMRSVRTDFAYSTSGVLYSSVSHLKLRGTMDLHASTFAGIKSCF